MSNSSAGVGMQTSIDPGRLTVTEGLRVGSRHPAPTSFSPAAVQKLLPAGALLPAPEASSAQSCEHLAAALQPEPWAAGLKLLAGRSTRSAPGTRPEAAAASTAAASVSGAGPAARSARDAAGAASGPAASFQAQQPSTDAAASAGSSQTGVSIAAELREPDPLPAAHPPQDSSPEAAAAAAAAPSAPSQAGASPALGDHETEPAEADFGLSRPSRPTSVEAAVQQILQTCGAGWEADRADPDALVCRAAWHEAAGQLLLSLRLPKASPSR